MSPSDDPSPPLASLGNTLEALYETTYAIHGYRIMLGATLGEYSGLDGEIAFGIVQLLDTQLVDLDEIYKILKVHYHRQKKPVFSDSDLDRIARISGVGREDVAGVLTAIHGPGVLKTARPAL